MALNCGNCLMEHAEIVELAKDGSCLCCKNKHRKTNGPKKKWKMPTWMKQWEKFIVIPAAYRTGGSIEAYMNVDGDSPGSDWVKAQVGLLEILHKNGSLPDPINEFTKGSTVKDKYGRIGKLTNVVWSVGYYLDDDPEERIYQDNEIKSTVKA